VLGVQINGPGYSPERDQYFVNSVHFNLLGFL
jgi:hypothetical protein